MVRSHFLVCLNAAEFLKNMDGATTTKDRNLQEWAIIVPTQVKYNLARQKKLARETELRTYTPSKLNKRKMGKYLDIKSGLHR